MILRRVPTSMLVALGLLPVDACKCPLGPCLEPPAVEDPDVAPCLSEPARPPDPPVDDTGANPCLTPIAPDDGSVTPCLSPPEPPADDGSVTPCLSPPEPPSANGQPKQEPWLDACLQISPPGRKGKGGGQGAPPADEPFASADVVRRVLERGALPSDVIARLRGRA